MRRNLILLAAVAAAAISAAPASAVTILAYGDSELGDVETLVGNAVTPPFDQVASAAGIALVIQYDSVQIGSDLVCHASAGISSKPEAGATAHVPGLRVSGSRLVRSPASIDVATKRDCALTIIREVTRNLMQFPIQELLSRSKDSLSGRKVSRMREHQI